MTHKHKTHHDDSFITFINTDNSKNVDPYEKFESLISDGYVLVDFAIDKHWKSNLSKEIRHKVLSAHYRAISKVLKDISPAQYPINKIVSVYYNSLEDNSKLHQILTTHNINLMFATTLALFKDGKSIKSKTGNPAYHNIPQNDFDQDNFDFDFESKEIDEQAESFDFESKEIDEQAESFEFESEEIEAQAENFAYTFLESAFPAVLRLPFDFSAHKLLESIK